MPDLILNNLIVKPFSETPPREYYVAAAIELSIDNIYLAMYAKLFSCESTKHIRRMICSNNSTIRALRSRYDFFIEKDIFDKLQLLGHNILVSDSSIERIIPNATPILDIINTLSGEQDLARITSYIHMVLAMACQYKYNMIGTLVSFSVSETHYLKHVQNFDTFTLSFENNRSTLPETLWYNIFSAMKFTTDNPSNDFVDICSMLHIDILPSVLSGIGVTTFSLLQFLSNPITKEYVLTNHLNLFDKGVIEYNLKLANRSVPWLSNTIQTVKTPAIEAVDTDQDEGGDLQPDKGQPEAGSPEASTNDAEAESPDKSTDDADDNDKSADKGTGDAEAEPPDESTDDADDSGEMSTPDNPPGEGGDDNTIEAKPMLFGLELKLAKNETLDDYLYKLSIANTISTILELNHDDLPPRTLTMIRDWKNMYLFLVASEETKRFLKQLKIKS